MARPPRLLRALAPALLLGAATVCLSWPAQAGQLLNGDKVQYNYAIYWDDMSAVVKGAIEPGGKVEFRDGPCTIQLVGKHDSIWLDVGASVRIHNGVMHQAE